MRPSAAFVRVLAPARDLTACFNTAEALAGQERHLEALAAWDGLIRLGGEGPLIARAAVGRGRALVALGRYTEAWRWLEGELMTTLMPALDEAGRFERQLALARAFGALGMLEPLDAAASEAMRVADQRGDAAGCGRAWIALMSGLGAHRAWDRLATEAASARAYARANGLAGLFVRAGWERARALGGLGRERAASAELTALLGTSEPACRAALLELMGRRGLAGA
ncbi:MAG: hypothetical protein H6739_32460 [Alphaproteobacteria bacterium]|nr:hypothetical protein [Alphaproteobacteria bacterium]